MMKKLNLSLVAALIPVALAATVVQAQEQQDGINVAGTVRVNYAYKDYSESSKDKGGDFAFDMAAIKFNGKLGEWGLASEYRFLMVGRHYVMAMASTTLILSGSCSLV